MALTIAATWNWVFELPPSSIPGRTGNKNKPKNDSEITSPATIQPIVPHRRIFGEFGFDVVNVLERDRVDERQRRHVADEEGQQRPEQNRRVGDRADPPQQSGTDQVQDAIELFLVHQAVAEEPNDQRSEESRPGLGRVTLSHDRVDSFFASEQLAEIGAHRDEEDPPDKELEEHHDTEANFADSTSCTVPCNLGDELGGRARSSPRAHRC